MLTKVKQLGYVVVTVEGKDTSECYVVDDTYPTLWKALKQAWGFATETESDGKTTSELVRIPSEAVVRKALAKPRCLPCLYDATKTYAKRMFGRELDMMDEEFYQNHPYVEKDGTPQPYTIRVIQELIEPWGLQVSRILMLPGSTVRGDLAQWKDVLGCNPLAILDHSTTNAQFAAMTEQSLEDVNKQYGFEFDERRLRPSISCGASDGEAAAGGGHATFMSPREKYPVGILQVQLATDGNWKQAPVFPELAPKAAQTQVDLYACLAPDGKTTIQEVISTIWKGDTKKLNAHVGGGSAYGQAGQCKVCASGAEKPPKHRQNVCSKCWKAFVSQFACSNQKCKTAFTQIPPIVEQVRLDTRDELGWRIETSCGACHHRMIFDKKVTPVAEEMANALSGRMMSLNVWNQFRIDHMDIYSQLSIAD